MKERTNYQIGYDLNVEFAKGTSGNQTTYTPDEVLGFVEASKMLAEGMKGMGSVSYYRDFIIKSIDIVEYLFAVAQGIAMSHNHDELNKEKIEGENEKRDLPPTPPIERKAKEGEEKKKLTPSARVIVHTCAGARTCEGAGAHTCEGDRIRNVYEDYKRIAAEADKLFDEFWLRYPLKVGKKPCRSKFQKLYRDARDKASFINKVFGGIDLWKRSRVWVEGFVCNPLTWLNQERWNDKPEMSSAAIEEEKQAKKKASNEQSAATLRKLGL